LVTDTESSCSIQLNSRAGNLSPKTKYTTTNPENMQGNTKYINKTCRDQLPRS